MGEGSALALTKAVGALDWKDVSGAVEQVDNIKSLLEVTPRELRHAPEEMILKWLLKHLGSNTPVAVRLRRHAATWKLFELVFERTPVVVVAKVLANRKFIPVLQTVLRDLSDEKLWIGSAMPNVDDAIMADAGADTDPAKEIARENLSPSLAPGSTARLECAGAVLGSLGRLLALRGVGAAAGGVNFRAGVQQLEALFSLPADEMAPMLAPLLAAASLALSLGHPPPEGWAATFDQLWGLRAQRRGEAFAAATHLARGACLLLGGRPDLLPAAWAAPLRRFLVGAVVLPAARAHADGGGRLEALRIAVAVTADAAAAAAPLLFDLAAAAPLGAQQRRRVDWVHAAFRALEEPVRRLQQPFRNSTMRKMLATAKRYSKAPAMEDLRSVCRNYVLGEDGVDFLLATAVLDVDADVFLLGDDGGKLLDKVLKATSNSFSSDVSSFLSRLAESSAQARDLSSFVKRWLSVLDDSFNTHTSGFQQSATESSLATHELVSETVARLLEGSMTPSQLFSLLTWLEEQEGANSRSVLFILNAIADGLSSEEFVDSVGSSLFKAAWKRSVTGSHMMETKLWKIACKTVEWSSPEERDAIWTTAAPQLSTIFQDGGHDFADILEPFRFVLAVWLSSSPDGLQEAAAADLAFRGLDRMTEEMRQVISEDTNRQQSRMLALAEATSWMMYTVSGSIEILSKKYPRFREYLVTVLDFVDALDRNILEGPKGADDTHDDSLGLAESNNASKLKRSIGDTVNAGLLINSTLDNKISSSQIAEHAVKSLVDHPFEELWSNKDARPKLTILDIPDEAISKAQREMVMSSWNKQRKALRKRNGEPRSGIDIKNMLIIMVKIMRRPTFYHGMKFGDLESISDMIVDLPRSGTEDDRRCLPDIIKLFDELVAVTIRNVAATTHHRKSYFKALPNLSELQLQEAYHQYPDLILRKALVLVGEGSGRELAKMIEAVVEQFTEEWQSLVADTSITDKDWRLQPVLVALGAADHVADELSQRALNPASFAALESACRALCSAGLDLGWRLWRYLVIVGGSAGEVIPAPPLDFTFFHSRRDWDVSVFGACVDSQLRGKDDAARLLYVRRLLRDAVDVPQPVGQLFAARRVLVSGLVDASTVAPVPAEEDDDDEYDDDDNNNNNNSNNNSGAGATGFGVAAAHAMLVRHIPRARSAEELAIAVDSVCALLESPTTAPAMTQWCVDGTLGAVAEAASASASARMHAILAASPRAFEHLCRPVAAVLKRHRTRVDGRFPLLLRALVALMRRLLLLSPPRKALLMTTTTTTTDAKDGRDDAAGRGEEDAEGTERGGADGAVDLDVWARRAGALARLVATTCEPSPASVARVGRQRAQGPSPDEAAAGASAPNQQQLDSAVAQARRTAGQHVGVLVMAYARLLLGEGHAGGWAERTAGAGGGRKRKRDAAEHGRDDRVVPVPIPRQVRDRFEREGLWAAWAVLSREGVGRMENALDAGGREMVRELYRAWVKFGKWSGV